MKPAAARWLRSLALLLAALALAGCKEGLYSGLNEHEANDMLAVLSAAGLDATKERTEGNDWQVQVDKAEMGRSLELLRAHGLPEQRYTDMGEIFKKQGLVSTPSEERMRYIFAVQQELSQTLREVDGVVSARVHVVIPANDPLSDKIRPSSAAVFIKYRPDVDLRLLVPTVKDLVGHSIEGLSHDRVSLSLVEAHAPPPPATLLPQQQAAPLLDTRTATILIALLLAAAVCVAVLPTLLRKQGLDWRTWARRQLLKRQG